MAYQSTAHVTGYGGAAGGGKTDFIVGEAITKHKRCLVIRKEKAQTEGVIQRMAEIVGNTNGFNSMKAIWKVPIGSCPLIEFGGLDNPGDERRWQGRPHDLKCFDEVTEMREAQVRFIMGWTRSNDPNVCARVIMTFNPPTTTEGRWVIAFFAPWLDKKHPNPALPGELRWFTTIEGKDHEVADGRPFVINDEGEHLHEFTRSRYKAEDIIIPRSRTFIPARLTDNPIYMKAGYMATLQSLPEPLRSQMLKGDFDAGIEDDAFQVIPTAWVDEAMVRWVDLAPKPEMESVGVDVARGGKDNTVIARRHGPWFDKPLTYPGTQTPDGPIVAGLVMAATRNGAPIHIDVIGVGSSPYDFLRASGLHVIGVNVSESATRTDQSGRFSFMNQRSEQWWLMREALDPANNRGIALPNDTRLKSDLCAPKWNVSGKVIKVEGREEIIKRIGRSPDYASAYLLALADTPNMKSLSEIRGTRRKEYDPYA